MPVSVWGVMLVEVIMPSGVSMARPPALRTPFTDVWHTAQSPSAASCCPRAMVAAENTDASGRAIGAIDRHGSTAAPTLTTAAQRAAAVASTPRRPGNGVRHLSDATPGAGAREGNPPGPASPPPLKPHTNPPP